METIDTTKSVCWVTVLPLLRNSELDVWHPLMTISEQWARKTILAVWRRTKSK